MLELADREGLEALELGSQGDLEQGESVVALGYPAGASLGAELSSTAGIVSIVRSSLRLPLADSPQFPNLVQTDAALNSGNSGGPLVDELGQLVGVNTAVLAEQGGAPSQGQGYAIGVDRVKEVLPQLRRGRSRGWFGAGLSVLPASQQRSVNLPTGIATINAVPATAAARARVGTGLVTAVNGIKLESNLPSYCDAVSNVPSGSQARLSACCGPADGDRRSASASSDLAAPGARLPAPWPRATPPAPKPSRRFSPNAATASR